MKPTAIQQMREVIEMEYNKCHLTETNTVIKAFLDEARRLAEIEAKEKPVAMNGHGIPVCPECGTAIDACKNCPPKPQADAGLVEGCEVCRPRPGGMVRVSAKGECLSCGRQMVKIIHPAHSTDGIVGESPWDILDKNGYMLVQFEYYRLGEPAPFWSLRIAKTDFPENWREYRGDTREKCLAKMLTYLLVQEETRKFSNEKGGV